PRLFAAAVLFAAFAALATAGPVPSGPGQQIPAKDENVEKAGEALKKGQVDEALKHLQEAVRKNPDLPPARFMLAKMFSQLRDMGAQARATLELAAAEEPEHPIIYLQNADIALKEGRLTDAILNCTQALSLANGERWRAD